MAASQLHVRADEEIYQLSGGGAHALHPKGQDISCVVRDGGAHDTSSGQSPGHGKSAEKRAYKKVREAHKKVPQHVFSSAWQRASGLMKKGGASGFLVYTIAHPLRLHAAAQTDAF